MKRRQSAQRRLDGAQQLFGKWMWSTFGSLWLSNPGIKQAASATVF